MKQPRMRVTDIYGKDYGYKKIMEMAWDNEGNLWFVTIDFKLYR